MFKKMLMVFWRDIKVNTRTSISLLLMVIPILLAIVVNVLAPGIEDTTVSLVLVDGENPAMVAYLEDYAKVQVVADYNALEARVQKRDDVIGIGDSSGTPYLLTQGNESKELVDYAKVLSSFYRYNRQVSDSTVVIKDFGVKVPPVKMLWANMGILLMTVLSGMLISLNIVDEKMDHTVSAINVTPLSRTAWIFAKSLIGIVISLAGSIAMIVIMGVAGNVNFAQLLVFVLIASLISIMIGFMEGLNSDDVMTAMASTKMIMLPLAASVAGYELLSANWQWVLYWSPFYWIYKGNIAILNGTMTWLSLLATSGIVLLIAALVFAYTAPRIRKGLE